LELLGTPGVLEETPVGPPLAPTVPDVAEHPWSAAKEVAATHITAVFRIRRPAPALNDSTDPSPP